MEGKGGCSFTSRSSTSPLLAAARQDAEEMVGDEAEEEDQPPGPSFGDGSFLAPDVSLFSCPVSAPAFVGS